MPKPFDKTTNLAIEISSKPPIQKMPTPADNLMADQLQRESHLDSKQEMSNPVDTSVASLDLKSFDSYINQPSSSPQIPSAVNNNSRAPHQRLRQDNPYRGFA
jgi:hypothetical protein